MQLRLTASTCIGKGAPARYVPRRRPEFFRKGDCMIIIDLLALWIAASLGYVCLMIIKPLPADRGPVDWGVKAQGNV